MAFLNKNYTTTCSGDLLAAINGDGAITPICFQIIDDSSGSITFEFSVALTAIEDTALDSLLSSFVCPVVREDAEVIVNDDLLPSNEVVWSSAKVSAAIAEASSDGGGIFGSELHYKESLGESTTTSYSWKTKLYLTTGSLPSGTYRIGWNYEWRGDTKSDTWVGVQLNGSTELMETNVEAKDNSSYHGVGGFAHATMSGTNSITLTYASENNKTVRVRNARLEIWRVS